MRYITLYEEYPIYEPAEGGYYYAGLQVAEYERLSKRKAKALMKKIWEECERENCEFPDDEYPWIKSADGTIWKGSKYIGDGKRYLVERKLGSHECGYEPYC